MPLRRSYDAHMSNARPLSSALLSFIFLFVLLFVCACIPLQPAPVAGNHVTPQPAAVDISVSGRGNTVTARNETASGQALLIIDVRSESGIGRATLIPSRSLQSATFGAGELRLHLAGLESLHIEAGDQMYRLSVSTLDDTVRQEASSSAGGDAVMQPLLPDDPRLLSVTRRNPQDNDGTEYYAIMLPPSLVNAQQPLTVEWVDFYR